LGMTANKNITQYPILANIGQYLNAGIFLTQLFVFIFMYVYIIYCNSQPTEFFF